MSQSANESSQENEGWKQKYRDAVGEFDRQENRWRDDQACLHKTLLRLSLSYLGSDPELDKSIKRLQFEWQQNPNAETKTRLIIDSIENINRFNAERNVDDNPSPDTFNEFLSKFSLPGAIGKKLAMLQQRSSAIESDLERLAIVDETIALLADALQGEQSQQINFHEAQAVVTELLEWMTLPVKIKQELTAIQDELEGIDSQARLSTELRDLGLAVSGFYGALLTELSDVERYLKSTAIRLKELQIGIKESFTEQRSSLGEQETLQSSIGAQMESISTQLETEGDMGAIKALIDNGLSEIRLRMYEHLARDRQRFHSAEKRFEALSDRLKAMGKESLLLREQVERERAHARYDALTGIPNRSAYDERIVSELSRFKRHGRPLSLAVIDIDKFKTVNDKFGHKAGDKVLRYVAAICAADVRTGDILARYGGEEFVLILPETGLENAYLAAEKLRTEIANRGFHYGESKVPITVSIGIAQFSAHETVDDVFQRADRALYAAKKDGRNRCMTDGSSIISYLACRRQISLTTFKVATDGNFRRPRFLR